MAYLHGTQGEITGSKVKSAVQAATVAVYVGTAPVNLLRNAASSGTVNTPIKLANKSDAEAKIGYMDDWSKYTLCEAVAAHFDNTVGNVGPIYVINVLDPAVHKSAQPTQAAAVIFSEDGKAEIASETIILDTIAVATKTLGTDYEVSYDYTNKKAIITSIGTPITGSQAVSYYEIDIAKVMAATIIGGKSADGVRTGLSAIAKIYMQDNAVTNIIAAPGWSEIPAVYIAMVSAAQKINGHWDAFVNADIPLSYDATLAEALTVTSHEATLTEDNLDLSSLVVYEADGTTPATITTDYTAIYEDGVLEITLVVDGSIYAETEISISISQATANDTITKAIAWKAANGYTSEFSKACWPMIKDGSGRKFHLSTMTTVNMLRTDVKNDNIPYESPSNKQIMATAQYFGEAAANEGFDQSEANGLNEKGITTAVYWGGLWVLWGPHTAAFSYGGNMDARSIFDVSIRIMEYITNKFQLDHGTEIDAPMSVAKKDEILNYEQEKLDTLAGRGALIGTPMVEFLETANPVTNLINGDFVWDISVTPTPPFKSGKARVAYTDEGFQAFYE